MLDRTCMVKLVTMVVNRVMDENQSKHGDSWLSTSDSEHLEHVMSHLVAAWVCRLVLTVMSMGEDVDAATRRKRYKEEMEHALTRLAMVYYTAFKDDYPTLYVGIDVGTDVAESRCVQTEIQFDVKGQT